LKVTRRGELALSAMIELARACAGAGEGLSAREMSRRFSAPLPFLEQVLVSLRTANLVRSRRGRYGGYRLARPPSMIFVAEILRAVDECFTPAPCVDARTKRACTYCPEPSACNLRSFWAEVSSALSAVLDSRSLAELSVAP
jgi:Rrf2 family protein